MLFPMVPLAIPKKLTVKPYAMCHGTFCRCGYFVLRLSLAQTNDKSFIQWHIEADHTCIRYT
jgi:hypothetical protein